MFSVDVINNEGYIATYGPIYLPWTKSGLKLSYRGLIIKDSIFNASITVTTVGGQYHRILSFSKRNISVCIINFVLVQIDTNTPHPMETTNTPGMTHPIGIGLKAGNQHYNNMHAASCVHRYNRWWSASSFSWACCCFCVHNKKKKK